MKNILGNSNFGFTKWCVAFIAFGWMGVLQVRADRILAWDFTGEGPNTNTISLADVFDSGLSSSNTLSRGVGAAWSTAGNSFRTQGFQNNGISTTNTDYFQFSLSATNGKLLSLNSITARFGGTTTYVTNSPGGATNQFAYSTNGANWTLIGSPTVVTGSNNANWNMTVVLSNILALQNLSNNVTASFRYYASGQTTTGGWGFYSSSTNTYGLEIDGTLSSTTTPTIMLNPTSLNGLTTTTGANSSVTNYTVTGANLGTTNITVTPNSSLIEISTNASTGFAANPLTLIQTGGVVSNTVYLRIANVATATNFSTTIANVSGTASNNLTVSGTVTAAGTPSVTVSPISATGLTNYIGQVSAPTNYTVTGTNLVSNLVVTASTNAIEVSTNSSAGYTNSFSLAPSAGGTLSNTVYVRMSALAPVGAVSGTVSNVSGSASNNFTVSGTVTQPALTLVLATNSVAENAGANATTGTVGIPTALSSNLVVSLVSSNTAAATVPSTVTIPNGQTNATFAIAAVANTNSYVDTTAAITASNASYASASATLTVQNVDVRVPTVVINKLYNSGGASGADDVVELLVVGTGQPGSTVNLQGMILKDYSSSAANDTGGAYIFSSNLLWGSVKAGTLIVLTKPGATPPVEDLDGGDFLIKINLSNGTYFTPGTGIFDIGGTELVQIKEANSGQAGSTGAIHSFAVGTSTAAQVSAAPVPKLICTTSGNYPYAQNNTQTLADFNGTGAAMAASALTMGIGNNATNSAYIASLRGSSDISISIASDAAIVREDAGLQSGKITVSLSSAASADLVVNLTASPSGIATIPASVTIPAGGSSATFDFTPINDNTIAGNRTVTFTGAANGWNSGNNAVTVVDVQFANPSVVINEVVNNGSAADSVELLAIQNNLSMVGMILKDFSTNMSGDAGAQYTFVDTALWQSVKSGTLIVLTMDATATEDTDASDGLVTVKLTNTSYFTLSGGSFDIALTDMVMIKSAGSGASGIAGAIHTFGSGTAGSLFKLANGAKLLFAAGGAGGGADNATSAISDYNGIGATAGNTLGTYNNASNQTYITALRASVVVPPTITSTNAFSGTVGVAFSNKITATGDAPITFSGTGLPNGLLVATNGVISGTPTAAGPFNATLTASNSVVSTNQAATFTIAKGTPVITAVPTALTINEGQALSNSTFSGGTVTPSGGTWDWSNPGNTNTVVGTNSYAAVYTPALADLGNWNSLTSNLTVVVNPAAPTESSFFGWLGSNAPSAELLLQYAYGAVSPSNTVNRSNLPASGVSGGNLVLTYYVRDKATNLSLVIPQLSSDLANTNSWGTNGITQANLGTNSVDGVNVVKKTAAVPIDSTNRKFLRLRISE